MSRWPVDGVEVDAVISAQVKPDGKDTRAGRRHVHTWSEPAQHAGMVGLLDRRVRGADVPARSRNECLVWVRILSWSGVRARAV